MPYGESDESLRVRRRITLAQLMAYLMIVAVGAIGFFTVEETQKHICDVATENRVATRNVVVAIENLGEDLILDGKPSGGATAHELQDLNYLREFSRRQQRLLEEPVCKEE